MFFDHHVMSEGEPLAYTYTDFLGGEKWVENPLSDYFRDARSSICDKDFDSITLLSWTNLDRPFSSYVITNRIANRVNGNDNQI